MPREKGYFRPEEVRFDYDKHLGDPGKFPYGRGLHETMYRFKMPTIRQFAGAGTARDTNERLKLLLKTGITGLSVALDLPTLMARDSNDPLSLGQVGWDGVAIDSIRDIRDLFQDIAIDKETVSFTVNAPAATILAMHIANAQQRGIPIERLGGTVQADILKEYAGAQNEWRYPIERGVDLVIDMAEYAEKNMPREHWNSVSGYHYREGGATAVQEVAFTLADGIAYIEGALRRGLDLKKAASSISFFFDVHNNFLEEIAKFRAIRVIWARIMRERFHAPEGSSEWCRIHAQTAGCSLTRNEPLINIVRIAYQAMAAYLGGVQSVHTNSYDEVLCTPTEMAARIAIRTQQILQLETGICEFPDLFGGAYKLEEKTSEIVEEAGAEIKRVDAMGGMISAIESGYPQREIRASALALAKEYDEKKILRVGENVFQDKQSIIEPGNIAEELKKRRGFEMDQLTRLDHLFSTRDAQAVQRALSMVYETAKRRERGERINMMPALIDAAHAEATVGEISQAMENAWGKHMEREIFVPHGKQMLSLELLQKYHLAYPLRILLAKGGLDGHDRPLYSLAELFKNLGAEVILPGLHCSSEAIAKRALEEDVDIVGISTHIGSPLILLGDIKQKLRDAGAGDVLMICGGIIRENERAELKKIGIRHFFALGTSHEDIAKMLHAESLKRSHRMRRVRSDLPSPLLLARSLTRVANHPRSEKKLAQFAPVAHRRAHVIGITGSASAGKSTLINQLIKELGYGDPMIVVLAVDPTEETSEGGILADVVHMREHYADPHVFLRSFGSRGAAAAMTMHLKEVVNIAAGYADIVIVETVGAGQADTAIKSCVDTFISLPDSRGDIYNLMKSGHHRHADILVVNMRTDSEGERRFVSLLKNFAEPKAGWTPLVYAVNAKTGAGIESLVQGLSTHKKFLEK